MNINSLKLCIAACIICAITISGQKKKINNDANYSISSTAEKIIKDYPYVNPVKPVLPANVKAEYSVIYKDINHRKLTADLFHPKNNGGKKIPALIMVHGGGWRSGIKSMEWYTAMELASAGYFCMAIEYRLSPEAVYPAAVYDILDAAEWVFNNADKYSIDKSKIVLMGESAGGHLVSLAGIKEKIFYSQRPQKGISSPRVSAIINVDGVMDMTVPSESGKDTIAEKPSAAKQWIGSTYKENPALWKEVSPVNYIAEDTPPMLFINSSMDRFHAGRDESIAKMKEYDIYSEVHTIPNSPHSFWFFHPWIDETIGYINSFLNKIFLNSKVSN